MLGDVWDTCLASAALLIVGARRGSQNTNLTFSYLARQEGGEEPDSVPAGSLGALEDGQSCSVNGSGVT